jgi:hypothetical protein
VEFSLAVIGEIFKQFDVVFRLNAITEKIRQENSGLNKDFFDTLSPKLLIENTIFAMTGTLVCFRVNVKFF